MKTRFNTVSQGLGSFQSRRKFEPMNTSLAHLPEYKQEQLKEITRIIVESVDPEKVILFGSHATGRWVEHRYVSGGIMFEYISDYDILVITKAGEERKEYELQDLIENRVNYKTPVTVILHDIEFINKMLSEGQYFFSDIENEGILLYDAGNIPLADRKPLSPADAQRIAQEDFDHWYNSSLEFLLGAKFYFDRNSLNIGAFNLHQATERAYHAVSLVFTGYKPKTHNLGKLKRYTKRFSEELLAVFPENSKHERHLFDLLKRGYLDARYKKDYRITVEEFQELLERVQKVQQIAREISFNKIAEIGNERK